MPFDHWGNVTAYGARATQGPGSKLARANVGQEAAHARSYRTGEQNGPATMGYANQANRLSRFGAGRRRVSKHKQKMANFGKRVLDFDDLNGRYDRKDRDQKTSKTLRAYKLEL